MTYSALRTLLIYKSSVVSSMSSCEVYRKIYMGETARSLGERVEEHVKSLVRGG